MTIFSAFCNFTIMPNSLGFAGLPLANDFGRRFEQAEDFAFAVRVCCIHALVCFATCLMTGTMSSVADGGLREPAVLARSSPLQL
jgi:hypothetical protein